MIVRAIISGGVWGDRRHQFLQAGGAWATCAGRGRCRECNREREEPYMSDDTKAKVRAVLEEHLGPDAKTIGDQDNLVGRAKNIEWVNVTIGLETEFDISLSETVVAAAATIDDIARLIDTILASKGARAH